MIFEKVREILVDQLGVNEEEVKLETNLMDDLGADSLDFFQVVMDLEDEFKIKIDNGEKIKTVEDAVKYIESAVEK
ncbi:acyl carrier protein [Clostridium sp.]|uniref:acyl carrier protein n=1 Tax=Clostridium sp. TaxID=1506 RepID=UPI0026037A4B|nr:acyl carrier protein [Clostridium sp.]